MAWSAQLHPKAPVGQANGGQFIAKGGSSASSSSTAAKKPAAKKTAPPNGLGYSAAQWAQMQGLEAMAKAGKKLDAHQEHELHVAHEKHLAAIGIKAKAVKKPVAKKPAVKKATVKAKPAAKK